MRQIVLDTETTGLEASQGHRIIEIGCVEIINRRLTGEKYQVYINPEREIEMDAIEVHGITNEFLEDKPVFKDIAKEFIEFIDGSELIAHNAPFDISFLNQKEFELENKCIDTFEIAQIVMTEAESLSLEYLANFFNVEHKDAHRALSDVYATIEVWQSMQKTIGYATFLQTNQIIFGLKL